LRLPPRVRADVPDGETEKAPGLDARRAHRQLEAPRLLERGERRPVQVAGRGLHVAGPGRAQEAAEGGVATALEQEAHERQGHSRPHLALGAVERWQLELAQLRAARR